MQQNNDPRTVSVGPFYFNDTSPYFAARNAWRSVIPNPLAEAAVLAALGSGVAVLGGKAIGGVGKAFLNPFTPAVVKQQLANKQYNDKVQYINATQKQRQQLQAKSQRNMAIVGALSGAALSLFLNADFDKKHFGLTKWSSMGSYTPDLDFGKPVNRLTAMNLFQADQLLTSRDPYAAAFGTSVVAAAGGLPNTVTLGTIYDSAVNKFQMQQQLGSFGKTALQTGKAYIAASLFTKALDSMVGLQPRTRDNIVSAGTWAGAISSIIH